MERLTDRNADGNYFYPKCFEKCDGLGASRKCDNCEITTSICEKLGKYEDLEEHGRLVKVGDVVYSYYYGYSKALDDLLNSLPDCDYVGIEHLVCLVEQLKRGEENDG